MICLICHPLCTYKIYFQELLSHCKHYSASVRHEGVTGLREILASNTHLVSSHLSDILEKCFEMASDKDNVVRRAVIKSLLKLILPLISEKQIAPFFPLICAHLCCAMTHINDAIKVDSLLVLDQLLEHYPRLMISKSNKVLLNFIEQISRQNDQGQGQGRSLSTNPDSETSSVHWRLSVLSRLQKFLDAVILCLNDESQTEQKMEVDENMLNFDLTEKLSGQVFPSFVRAAWASSGFVYRYMY